MKARKSLCKTFGSFITVTERNIETLKKMRPWSGDYWPDEPIEPEEPDEDDLFEDEDDLFETPADAETPEAILQENEALTLEENFANVLAMGVLDPEAPLVLVTSNYQMDRAVKIAEEAGFARVTRLPAAAGFWAFGANLLYETWMARDPAMEALAAGE